MTKKVTPAAKVEKVWAPAPGTDPEFEENLVKVWEALEASGNPEGITLGAARETLAHRNTVFGGKTYNTQGPEEWPGDIDENEDGERPVVELVIPTPSEAPYWYEEPEQAQLIDHYIMTRRALGNLFHGALLIVGPAGCLSGDTLINVNRAGKGSRMPIKHIVTQHTGNPRKAARNAKGQWGDPGAQPWRRDIPTRVARAEGDVVKLGTLKDAWHSGDKETYTLTTTAGRSIRATLTHPFLRADGDWSQLGDLSPGDEIRVNTGRSTRGSGPKPVYHTMTTRFHPHQVWASTRDQAHKVPTHRLAVEAVTNGLPLAEYVAVLRTDPVRAGAFTFIAPDRHVHHLDGNPINNELDNLVELSEHDHYSLHAKNGHGDHVLWQVGSEVIQSIERYGIEPTYDIAMVDEPHNFLANGFVVHNSGKTMGVPQAVARLNAKHNLSMRMLKMDCPTITDPQKWFGRREVDAEGTHYIESDFIRGVREGNVVILLDELTRIHPTIGNVVHSLLDGSQALHLSELNITVPVAQTTVFLATANIGAQFGGTHRMDWALRERFAFTVARDFPPKEDEIRILTTHTGCDPDAASVLVNIAAKTRAMYATGDLRSPISTRTLVAAAWLVASGMTEREAMRYTAEPLYDADSNGMVGEKSERMQVRSIIELR